MSIHVLVALRTLVRRPGLAAGRILTITVVIAALAAVLTVADATFLRPLPFPDSERLVRVFLQPPGTAAFVEANPLDPFEFVRLRGRTQSLDRFEGIWVIDRAVAGEGEPDTIRAGQVSAGFFDLLGGEMALGRRFTEREVDNGDKLVVLGDGLWQRRFGGALAAVGRVLLIDREPHVIVGVTRRGFEPGFTNTELWTPLTIAPGAPPLNLTAVQPIARLAAGASGEQARAELDGLVADIKRANPSRLNGYTVGVIGLREAQFGSRRAAIQMLVAAVLVLALIAMANLANLTLVDLSSRRTDFSIRSALGASCTDLALPEIVQSVCIAAIGGTFGLAGASWLVPAMLALDPSNRLTAAQMPVDWRIAAVAFAAAVVVIVTAAALPVLRVAGPRLASDVSRGNRRSVGDRQAHTLRSGLVTAQVVLAVVLLSSGALVASALQHAARIDPGFDPENVVAAQLKLSGVVLPTETDRAVFVDRVLERLRATPGVVNAAATLNPFTVGGSFQTMVHIEGRPTPDGQPYTVQFRRVSPGYFETMRIGVVSGRPFDAHDKVGSQPVVIVSRSFARRFWDGQDPLGRRIKRGAAAKDWSVVVGVVGDARDVGLEQPMRETVYTPYFQASNAAAPVGLVVRTAVDPAGSIKSIQRAVWAIDASQPLGNITTLEAFLRASLGQQRFRAILVGVCGLLGLMLATIGIYGVTARTLVERRREVGVRLALGGRPFHVWWAISRTSLKAIAVGAIAGSAASSVAGAMLSVLLPELSDANWMFTAAAACALAIVGGLTTLLAARGASTVDPLELMQAD